MLAGDSTSVLHCALSHTVKTLASPHSLDTLRSVEISRKNVRTIVHRNISAGQIQYILDFGQFQRLLKDFCVSDTAVHL